MIKWSRRTMCLYVYTCSGPMIHSERMDKKTLYLPRCNIIEFILLLNTRYCCCFASMGSFKVKCVLLV